ncbi:hypothetical protein N0V94_003991 [Neodidymelliopsis sp. IMI 364377]|nr:hypothetical protein N0V94_003991 [Neodidymelliopsis sp. IMI 364377]
MTDPNLPTSKTDAVYQKDMYLYTHTSPITTIHPLSSLPPSAQILFKPPPEETGTPYILTSPSTIFHAQGGGQPSDTGTISTDSTTFTVHQVRRLDSTILHMGVFSPPDSKLPVPSPASATQEIDIEKRSLHSRIHTAGHVLGLAAAQLKASGLLPADLVDGKASHYPGAAFVEFVGLIPGEKKAALQGAVDELVERDLGVKVFFWDEERARTECSYPCGGTHVKSTKECGRIVVRNIKRQKGITKVSYEVQDV